MTSITKPMAGRGQESFDLKRELGAYIRDLRVARGLTQRQLAELVDMQWNTAISAIEIGRNVVPPERYSAFARALGVDDRKFMKEVLRLTNPWAYAMFYAANPAAASEELSAAYPERINRRA